jgi:hypothetical protein
MLDRRTLRRWPVRCALGAVCLGLLLAGCGYSIRPPFDPGIRTVYVPIFRSFTYKRDLNYQLTDLVQQKIRQRTTFKVVGSPEGADATLEGIVKYIDKNSTVESPNNLPRQVTGTLQVEVRFIDNRRIDNKKDYPPNLFQESVTYYPELGETTELGFYKAFDRLADQIVSAMESPW